MPDPTPYPDQPFDAFLFDMDGTLLTSIASAERVWTRWLLRHGHDPLTVLASIHGVQTIETVRRLAMPGSDPVAEAAWIAQEEVADLADVQPIEGAAAFLADLPADGWAIVTSATRPLAEARLRAAGLVAPSLFITAEDIPHGKPAPDCYLEAARRLGRDPARCLVFEDAPAGIAAGRAAGSAVVVVTATHRHPIDAGYPAIRDFTAITSARRDGRLTLVGR